MIDMSEAHLERNTAMRNYRFEISTAFGNFTSIIIRSDTVEDARTNAHTALKSVFSRGGYDIKSSNADVKVMRRMPKNLEPLKNCVSQDMQWAWLVYK